MIDLTSWQWTALALPQAIAAALTLIASQLVRPHRDSAIGANWLYIMLLSEVLWSSAGALEFCSANLPAKVLFSQISYIGIALGPLAIIQFVHAYIHGGAKLPRPVSLFYGGLCAVIILGALTNSWHHRLWPDVLPVERYGMLHANYLRGPLFWITIGYCYVTMATISIQLIRHTLRIGGVFSRQSALILLATLAPWVTSIIYILRIGPAPELDHTPVGFAITGLLLSWAVLRLRLFDLVPISTNTLFDRIPDPVLVIDSTGRLVRANQAAHQCFSFSSKQFGLPLSQAITTCPVLTGMLTEHNEPLWKADIQEASKWWAVESGQLEDGFSHKISSGRLILLRDITEQKQAQTLLAEALKRTDRLRAEAEAANAAKGHFLAQVSHDLRTPLHAIVGFSELLLAGKLEAGQRADITSIHDAGSILQRLINDLLDLSRIDAGHIDLAESPYCLDDAIDPVLELLILTARAKKIGLHLHISPELPPFLMGDIDRLRQVLFNLVGNAVKFTASGNVSIKITRQPSDSMRIDISDTGAGIPEEQLKQLFEPFIRGGTTVRSIEGTGLGLSISRRIARSMGGDITVTSSLGKGSTFRVTLPIRPAEPDKNWITLTDALRGQAFAVIMSDENRQNQVINALLTFGMQPLTVPSVDQLPNNSLVISDQPVSAPEGRRIHVVSLNDHTHPAALLKRRSLAGALLPPAKAPASIEVLNHRLYVLIADDNLVNRKVGAAMLARNGCSVVTVEGGIDALNRVQQESFDLIVLDGQMDDLNGWEVAQRIRSGEAGEAIRDIPIIALSADLTTAARTLWSDAGVSDLLGKPVKHAELASLLGRLQIPPN